MKKRALHYLILVALVVVVNFFIPRLLPGSPIGTLVGENAQDMTAAEKMGVLDAYHLNDPLPRSPSSSPTTSGTASRSAGECPSPGLSLIHI